MLHLRLFSFFHMLTNQLNFEKDTRLQYLEQRDRKAVVDGTYVVHLEKHLKLRNNSIPGFLQDSKQHLLIQWRQAHGDRDSPDKLWDHTKLNHIPGLHLPQEGIPLVIVYFSIWCSRLVRQIGIGRSTSTLTDIGGSSKSKILWEKMYQMKDEYTSTPMLYTF